MATLIVEHEGRRSAALLSGRVVIGRRANSHVVVQDRTVSRIHAWIAHSAGKYFVVDSGSRVGTLVNGKPLRGRHPLADGDTIRVGPAVITFHANGELPADAEAFDLSPRPVSGGDGIFLDCSCGAPLWAPWDFAGRLGQCRYCGQMVELPPKVGQAPAPDPSADTIAPGMPPAATKSRGISLSPRHEPPRVIKPSRFDTASRKAEASPPATTAASAPASEHPPTAKSFPSVGAESAPIIPPPHGMGPARTKREVLCGACQSTIADDEETSRCPDCGVSFHAGCWVENRGCSSYGCKQVGILEPKPIEALAIESNPIPHTVDPPPRELPAASPTDSAATTNVPSAIEWDYLVLPLALACSLVGLVAFGIPALLAGAGILVYRRNVKSISHPRMVLASMIISSAAMLAGVAFSWYWWLGGARAAGGI